MTVDVQERIAGARGSLAAQRVIWAVAGLLTVGGPEAPLRATRKQA